MLTLPEPRRIRDRDHVRFVAKQPCLICGRMPSDAHHLRFAQSRALGRKVSDEFTVPLCRGHHREVHHCGDEAMWWKAASVDPTIAAGALWRETHPLPNHRDSEGIDKSPSKTTRKYRCEGKQAQWVDRPTKFEIQNEANYRGGFPMTSFRQWQANRNNARKSTGPITEEGKKRSRCNAVRHGLTAETVIGVLEDAEDYRAFEAAIIADYDAQSAVERELVLRLASLLWRLRRAAAMETGLFDIQAEHLNEFRKTRQQLPPASRDVVFALFGGADGHGSSPTESQLPPNLPSATSPSAELARCFLRLANMPSFVLDRLSRYEVALWRQVGQMLMTLDALDRRKPQERGRHTHFSARHVQVTERESRLER